MKLLAWLVAVALVAAACGEDEPTDGDPVRTILTAGQAQSADGPVRVQGFMLAIGGVAGTDVRLCDAVLESFPPQCGEPSIAVINLNPFAIAGMQSSGNVFWAEGVRVAGSVTDGVLEVGEIELSALGSGLALRLEIQGPLRSGSVAWVVHLSNTSGEPIDLVFLSSQQADVAFFDNGAEVYRWSDGRGFDLALVNVTLQPGEAARYVLEDQLDLPAGQYRVEVTLAANPDPGVAAGVVEVL